ncbi:GvpL/GvpF family gas vesicle protein [Streptomyces phytohabitans]|uniref:GvpL/GvpF family gas vesicle protein n=1 Tax=Streptomyces phytohabitans TaxID=1150371 RepID=UPI00345BD688
MNAYDAHDDAYAAPDTGRLSYAYAVGRATPELEIALGPATGMDGAPLRTVAAHGLAAVVCDVPEAAYGERALRARLEDLGELEELARAHHSVVESLARGATVLPLRLATVYLDDVRVAAMLRDAGPELAALLGRLEGRVEWGVKVYADPSAAASPSAGTTRPDTPDAPAPEAPAESPGRAYLRQRRAQRTARDEAHRTAQEAVRRALAAAAEYAEDRVTHRPQQGELATGSGQNLANEAFLVARDRSEEFRAAVEEADRGLPGVRIEVTGPWAPYSFATPVRDPAPVREDAVREPADAAGGREEDSRAR